MVVISSKKILFFVSELERGGLELRLLNFARYFPKNYQVYVWVMSDCYSLKEDFERFGAKVIVAPIRKIYLSLGTILKLLGFIKQNDIKIINAFDLKGFSITLLIKFMNKKHINLVFHNVNSLKAYKFRQKILLLSLIRFCDCLVANSNFSKMQIRKHVAKGKLRVLYNGVNTDFFRKDHFLANAKRLELGINAKAVVLGTIGNFRQQKNYGFLLCGFEMLLSKYPDLRLLCVGGGDGIEEMKKTIKEKGLEQKVLLTGYTQKAKEFLNIMDVFVLTSLYEGLPNAVLEAMSMELPVIVSNVGGCPELIDHLDNGCLFPVDDMAKFLEAVESVIKNEEFARKLANNARKKVEQKFSLNRMIKNYQDLYEQLYA